jgi:hypothetical protein
MLLMPIRRETPTLAHTFCAVSVGNVYYSVQVLAILKKMDIGKLNTV